jgi:hypothetical protein
MCTTTTLLVTTVVVDTILLLGQWCHDVCRNYTVVIAIQIIILNRSHVILLYGTLGFQDSDEDEDEDDHEE